MFEALANFFQLILQPCFRLTGNWWVAIFLFTAITKVILMPLALWCQKNSIVMVEFMPELFRIKTKYFGDREAIDERQNQLYKDNHYNALLSLVPLAIQVIILMGLSDVIHSITDSGAPGTEFLGLVPIEDGGLAWIMPVLATASAVAMGYAANKLNPLQKEQTRAEQNMTNALSIALSAVLAIFVVCGMAFYWVCSNLLAIVVQVICNIVIDPKKTVDYEDLAAARAEYEALEEVTKSDKKWYQRDPNAARAKKDYKRFFKTTGKHLVFYSEGSGFYKYYRGAIEWLLAHSDIRIHYITGDPDDQVFGIAESEPRLIPYYLDQRRLITALMKLDADVFAASLDDLDNYYLKRSYVRKDIVYCYLNHAILSLHLTGTKEAYWNYDAFLAVGPHHEAELRRAEELYGLKRKDIPHIGYDLLDTGIAAWEAREKTPNDPPVILIAPSWNPDNLLDVCIDEMLEVLLGHGYRVIVRPHPEYTKRYRPRWDALRERWASVPESELYFERDFSSGETILESDVIITDWSTINAEFSFTTLKPSVHIDTPMKVRNPDWQELEITPTDISIRDEIGRSVSPDHLEELPEIIDDMIAKPEAWAERIARVRERTVYNLGHGGEAAGEYLLTRVLEQQERRAKNEG